MSPEAERDQALAILRSKVAKLSTLYRECYLAMGRGALLVYTRDIIEQGIPQKGNYRTRREILEVFDEPSSFAKLGKMIDNYSPAAEGIMTLITNHSNATYFITVKLK